MEDLANQLADTIPVLDSAGMSRRRVGVILGSGLGPLAEQVARPVVVPYDRIPHFPRSTAVGHAGRLIAGELFGAEVVCMQGRFHGYEGYTARQTAYPVWVMKALGVQTLIVSNAAGGVRPGMQVGELMVLDDVVNLTFDNPLRGVNDESQGPRWPDMGRPFCPHLQQAALAAARAAGFLATTGVYCALQGPNYETRAEIRMLRTWGVDAVGMSTAAEVIAATYAGLRCFGVSVITNVCTPVRDEDLCGDHVVDVAKEAAPRLAAVVEAVVRAADIPASPAA